jgi:Icc protein
MTDRLISCTTRRRWLGGMASFVAGSALSAAPSGPPQEGGGRKEFRFVHMTDIHVQPERGAVAGVKQCVRAINSLPAKADFTITGGDLIMDALEVGPERVRLEWQLFDECFKTLETPVYHTIGNHDVVGWSAKSVIQPGETDYGKKLFADRYGEGCTYRSFDHQGWHFILLDSIGQDPVTRDYLGWVDEEQQAWLKADLEKTGRSTPIIVVTHVPFYSVWNQMNADPRRGENPKSLVNNAHVLRKLLAPYQVKLVLSGHGHVLERIDFHGTTFIQGGAVCGMWWKGPVFGNPEGFGVVTCKPDGSFEYDYHDYGWKVVKA